MISCFEKYKNTNMKQLFFFFAIFFFISHAYCFLNLTYSHDSLMIFQIDGNWQISLGRIFQPMYVRMRGMITAPLWLGTLTFSFTFAGSYFLSNLLGLSRKFDLMLVSGILATSATLTLVNATYIPWSDIYMLAFLLNVLGAFIASKYKKWAFLTVICFVLSLGLYQAYIQVGVILLMFDVFKDVILNKEFKLAIKKSVFYVLLILVSFALYFCLFKLFLALFHIEATNNYNGLTRVGHFGGIKNMVKYFVGSYKYVFKIFLHPLTIYKRLTVTANFILLLASVFLCVKIAVQNKLSKINIIFLAVLILLFPFGFNFIYFISQGMEHELMIFSFSVVPLFTLYLLNSAGFKKRFFKVIPYIAFCLIIIEGIIFANQCYVKKHLERQSTLSIVTRIIDRIEQTEGYVPGETAVCFIGKFDGNSLIPRRAGFDYSGAGNSCWATATYNIEQYIQEYLAYPMKRAWEPAPPQIEKQLSPFPAKNCILVENGILYVKISGEPALSETNIEK